MFAARDDIVDVAIGKKGRRAIDSVTGVRWLGEWMKVGP